MLYIIVIHSFPLCAAKKPVRHTKVDHDIKLNLKIQNLCNQCPCTF